MASLLKTPQLNVTVHAHFQFDASKMLKKVNNRVEKNRKNLLVDLTFH